MISFIKTLKKHRIYIYIILFLILGLYIDIKMTPKDYGNCWGNYRQRTLNIQTVVPFHPNRFTFYFGVGNKHWEANRSIRNYFDSDTGQLLEREVSEFGCSVPGSRVGRPRYMSKYINLRPFAPILGEGMFETYERSEKIELEDWERYYR